MAHYPKFIEESISHALAAAARAVTSFTGRFAVFGWCGRGCRSAKCVGCLTCTRTCPFGIPQVIQEEGRWGRQIGRGSLHRPAQCQGCGTCTGRVPANAIQLINYTDEQMMLQQLAGWEDGYQRRRSYETRAPNG
jgi:heterodisulfide reductase subunit A2